MNTLAKLKNDLAKELYGKTVKQATEDELCISCGEPALENCYSEAGKREFYISGLCEKCFDKLTLGM